MTFSCVVMQTWQRLNKWKGTPTGSRSVLVYLICMEAIALGLLSAELNGQTIQNTSDKWIVLCAGAVVAFVAAVFVYKQPVSFGDIDTDTKILAITGASALWGIYTGAQPVVESIFADSVATGTKRLVAWCMVCSCKLFKASESSQIFLIQNRPCLHHDQLLCPISNSRQLV